MVPGVSARPSDYSLPYNQYDYHAFSSPGTFPLSTLAYGNLGRNTLRGPSVFNWDFSLFKNFRVREHQTLEFRAEMFNMFNTPEFAGPAADISSPASFGKTFATIGSSGGFGSNRIRNTRSRSNRGLTRTQEACRQMNWNVLLLAAVMLGGWPPLAEGPVVEKQEHGATVQFDAGARGGLLGRGRPREAILGHGCLRKALLKCTAIKTSE